MTDELLHDMHFFSISKLLFNKKKKTVDSSSSSPPPDVLPKREIAATPSKFSVIYFQEFILSY